ncbi:hypothetical protein FSP39_002198 [Pinctada imbricata]|uniref:Uncharacterized protein n=1 Tax=Pinctada imbricata TaxID=66713 RepID=A0AA88Y115_PINIB|nr:hypothetical protein FSP39_002198 [Pinctada imbricata]
MDVPLPPPQMSPHGGHPKSAPSPQGFNQAALQFSPQGPRPAGPPGSHASALQSRQQRPAFQSAAVQVRQSLLQQQKLKQMREVEKQRLAQQQERQRQLMQRQLSQQFSQRFPQNMDNSQLPPFPENLAELMNSGNAPNVTLQRNQIPGPMSPRFGPGIQQQQHPNLSQLIGPNPPPPASPISPHFNQQPPKQWNMRNQQGMQSPMGIPSKSSQYNINRHRSLSGGTVTSGNQSSQFQFPEQFGTASGNGQMMMYNQQQSMYQNRIMRQMSLPPGRGSPRTPASPFGNSPDPLLMSPHSSISPNSSMRNPQTSQISPPYNQASMSSTNYGVPGSMTGLSNQPIMSQASTGGQGYQDFDMQLADLEKSGLGMGGGNTTSQYVKQEIRNICSARSDQKQLQTQQSMPQSAGQSMSQSLPQSMSQSGGQSLPQPGGQSMPQAAGQSMSQNMPQSGGLGQSMSHSMPQSMNSVQYSVAQSLQQQPSPALRSQSSTYDFDDSSEIPSDIIEDIHQMEKEHQTHAAFDINNFKEDDILKVKRQEAKHIYEQFRALANREKEITTTTTTAPLTENPEIKASTLFRNQLTTQRDGSQSSATPNLLQRLTSVEKQQVQVVAKEPRNMVEDIKPPDHKNSLLQQLLSE